MKMTNEIAFDLGAFNYPCFYDKAVFKEGFKYVDFFDWSVPDSDELKDSDLGELKEEKFEMLEYKYYYIKGRLISYSVIREEDKISVYYANSFNSRDRFVKWIKELIENRFGQSKKWYITTSDAGKTIPATPSVTLEADKDIIKYFKGED